MKTYISKKVGGVSYMHAFYEVRVESFGSEPHVAVMWEPTTNTGTVMRFGWIPLVLWDDLITINPSSDAVHGSSSVPQ